MGNTITPAIVIKSRFILNGQQGKKTAKKYIDYIGRTQTKLHQNELRSYQDYMSDNEKSTGLFTNYEDNLDEKGKQHIKNIFDVADKQNSILWQDVISFDNQWLKDNGILQENYVDEKRLKQATRLAVNEMLKKEKLIDSAIWTASIHYNTDNIHIHVATVQVKDIRARGNRKQKSLDVMKSKFANAIDDRSLENKQLNSFIRDKLVAYKKNDDLTSLKNRIINRELTKQFKYIHSLLPEDKRTWRYNMNGIAQTRIEVDKLTDMYIDKYFKEDFKNFNKQLDNEVEFYRKMYGGTKADKYRETKMKDLYTRMGNAILTELREYDYKINGIAQRNTPKNKLIEQRDLNNFMYQINGHMKDELQSYKNQRAYDELIYQQDMERGQ